MIYETCENCGWAIALALAGWPEDREVWTGSCPCQPFSSAGRQKGKSDERHLWPVWFELIKAVQPATIYGEQVASAIGHGWLDEVAEDLESVRFTNNRESMHRMQDPQTFDRVSEILWAVKRGRPTNLQNLPEGIREEVAQFVERIQGQTARKAPRLGQIIPHRLHQQKQGSLFDIAHKDTLLEKRHSVRSGSARGKNQRQDCDWDMRGQRVSSSDEAREAGLQQPVNRQDKAYDMATHWYNIADSLGNDLDRMGGAL